MMRANALSAQKKGRLTPVLRCAWTLAAIIALLTSANANEIGNKNRKANRLYSQGKYDEALKLYDEALEIDPRDGKLKMNRGSAQFRLEDYEGAENSYLDALNSLPPKDKKTLADAHYNLGNIRYRQGELYEAMGNAGAARGKFTQALEDYTNTLKLRPSDMDAKWNLQLAHQKTARLEEQQQEQEQSREGDDGAEKQPDDSGGQDDKKDQDNKESRDGDESANDGDDQKESPQPRDQERDMKKEEAERLIEQYADDADTLNRPMFQRGKIRQPEKDW